MAIRHTPEIAELLPVHALGALDGPDRELLDAHLAQGCPECRRELERLEGDVEALAAALGPVAPSDTARARLLRALDHRDAEDGATGWPESSATAAAPSSATTAATGPTIPAGPGTPATPATPVTSAAPERTTPRAPGAPPSRPAVAPRRAAWAWLPLAAAVVLLVLSGLSFWNARREVDRLGTERERLARQVASLDRELEAARAEGRRLARALEVVSAPGMQPTVLASLGGRSGSGRAFLDPASKRAVFVASGLEPLPADRDYELWFIAGGKPVAAGTFDVDASGNARIEVEDVAPPETIDAWAVTVEPAGGLPQPSGEMVLKG